MGLSQKQIENIERTLKSSLRYKFQNYTPEPASMPFHTRLLGKDRLALYSFIHSLSTNFGTSIFEPVAVALAKNNFKIAEAHYTAGEFISERAQLEIQKIMDNLTTAVSTPDKSAEIETIRKVCQEGHMIKVKPTQVDIFLEGNSGELYLFDIKTAKPNAGNFKEFKRTLLEWAGVILSSNPSAKVNTIIAIPYNPYEPQPYNRWTIRGMLDLKNELLVGNEFWNFLGGPGAYDDLLDCFERVGIELRPEIDQYFARFNR
ncbi:MAG TPA: TdeIII family type II restriction endonuclease [Candidatus Methanoperedenaceae archaeon]|nr:TdeIII family type II restriction endonuclease [Candidatus Methanoperedenaceae archaeon]